MNPKKRTLLILLLAALAALALVLILSRRHTPQPQETPPPAVVPTPPAPLPAPPDDTPEPAPAPTRPQPAKPGNTLESFTPTLPNSTDRRLQNPPMNAERLVGLWSTGGEYYRFDADHHGVTWDPSDDIAESEAQTFSWTLEDNQLILTHPIQLGGFVPKTYNVIRHTDEQITLRDDYKTLYCLTRVTQ